MNMTASPRSGRTTAAAPAAAPPAHPNAMIIIVESGIVRDILPTGPVEAVVIDLDMIEDGDSVEERLLKAVAPIDAAAALRHNDLTRFAACLVKEYRRPACTASTPSPDRERAA